jgi:uncharacterized membrane protein HdeD (DUF308 family)
MEPIERIKPFGFFLGLLLIVIGIVFIVIPSQVVSFMATLIGVVLVVTGLIRVLVLTVNWKEFTNQILHLILGLAIIGAGIFMIVNTQITITLIGIVLGIFAILMALDRFFTAFSRKEDAKILPSILFGLIHLAFGVGLIYASMAMFSAVVILYGIYFLVAGALIVLSMFLFKDF